MSALLESLLDTTRLADVARNDALAGIPPPPVELDERYFLRADLSMPSAEERERRVIQRELERAANHPGELARAAGWTS